MKFHFGPVPDPLDFIPDAPWQALDEPSINVLNFVILPYALATLGAVFILWFGLTPLSLIDLEYFTFIDNSTASLMVIFVILIILHELLHTVIHPGFGLSSQSILGLWLSRGVFYAAYAAEWSRNRAVACLLTPFLTLSILPLILAPLFSGDMMALLCFVSLVNAFASCADLFFARLIFLQVPADGILRNKGYRTYWKRPSKHLAG